MFQTSVVFEANYNATEEIVVNQGGTSSGKTYSILQCLFLKTLSKPHLVTTIAGQDIPNLKVGPIRDCEAILDSSRELRKRIKAYNKTDRKYTFINGSIMEFQSYDDEQDAKSGKRDYLFVNEANGFRKNVFDQLHLRTKIQTYIDYNPDAEFWVHEDIIPLDSSQLIISDHRHNPFVAQKIRDKIESIKDPELFKVYARGLTGKVEGLVFRNYELIDSVAKQAELIGYGLDFGFTNDPTALVGVYRFNGKIVLDEMIYDYGLTNPEIAKKIKENGVKRNSEVIADSAEPKSIEEIFRHGVNIKPAKKGKDSIRASINTLKEYDLLITRRSVNLRKEFKTYKWLTDKHGKPLNEPVDFNNHGIDAVRYLALNKLTSKHNGTYFLR